MTTTQQTPDVQRYIGAGTALVMAISYRKIGRLGHGWVTWGTGYTQADLAAYGGIQDVVRSWHTQAVQSIQDVSVSDLTVYIYDGTGNLLKSFGLVLTGAGAAMVKAA